MIENDIKEKMGQTKNYKNKKLHIIDIEKPVIKLAQFCMFDVK